MSVSKKGFSVKEIQRQLGLKRYEPVWAMVHKLRRIMENRDAHYIKAKVLDVHNGESVNKTIKEPINNQSIIFTDKGTSYVDISKFVELHVVEKSTKETTEETLKWIHIAISNGKRSLLGNYHKIKRKYLQLYLNEFVYKLNMRYFGDRLFERFVIANITARG